jgi:hypothetical protein
MLIHLIAENNLSDCQPFHVVELTQCRTTLPRNLLRWYGGGPDRVTAARIPGTNSRDLC